MRLAARFWVHIAMWTGILFAILTIISLLSGQDVAQVIANIPVWGGLALILSAFPVGLAVAPEAIPEGDPQWRPLVEFVLAALAVSLLALILAGFVGPAHRAGSTVMTCRRWALRLRHRCRSVRSAGSCGRR